MSDTFHESKHDFDVEKDDASRSDASESSSSLRRGFRWGVEARGTVPVPYEDRRDTQFYKVFFVWFSMNFNILSFSTGALGPVVFNLGLRDSCLVILFFNLIANLLPAYLNTWGPKTGMRQMIASRYSFGFYGVIIPTIFNLTGLCGFNILNCILGGQALSSVTNNNMSWTVGIVVIGLLSMIISFMGYKVLNWYERLSWPPVLLAFLVALGVGGKNLHYATAPPAVPATASQVLSFAATIAGFVITYSAMASDFTMYLDPKVSGRRIFCYAYLGYVVPIVALECLGAAAVLAAPSVDSWNKGYGPDGNIGGLLEAMLSPAGNFGKFLTVMLALSVSGNIACTLYSICFNFQVLVPKFSHVPRYVFSVVGTAIAVPLSIVGAHKFYSALTNFLSLIGYWASAYGGVLLVEHLYFRKGDFSTYDQADWNVARRLPWGAAALGAVILAFGLVIPCMDQVWLVGPIGRQTGDIGFEVAFPLAALFYVPLRTLERRYQAIS